MTPKEKAEELFNKYRPIIAGKQFVTGFVLMSEAKELTKQSALIAVDEIIKNQENVISKIEYKLLLKDITLITYSNYWNEVKHELEKL